MRWNKFHFEVSLTSLWTQIRRPSSEIKFRVVALKTPRFSTAIGSNLHAEDRVEYICFPGGYEVYTDLEWYGT